MPLAALQNYTAYFLLFLHQEMARRFSFPLFASGYIPVVWKELWICTSYEELDEKLCIAVRQLGSLLLHPMNKSWEYVTKAFIYVKKMYTQDISLEDIAEQVGISPFYLSRLLKQELNETFVEILTKVRIGEAVGYNNTTYFYKVFKKQTGMTVGEVRHYL